MDAYDFVRFGTVVDVGGGRGALLAMLLAAHPRMRGVLFDLPHVIASLNAISPGPDVAARCRTVAGSFFEGVPAGGDAYVLRVRGDSMIEAHIADGDFVLIRPQTTARNGDIVVAQVEENAV